MALPCVFFDRDGIVNRSPGPGYVERVEDFELLPEFVEALGIVRGHGYEAIIVTNQRGITLGRMSAETVDRIHAELKAALGRKNLELRAVYVCPHDNNECDCRKPKPGMLLEAAKEHDLDLAKSWMVGDSETDIEAGRRAGCRTVLVAAHGGATAADYQVSDMSALAGFLDEHL